MANKNTEETPEVHSETEGLQWEVSKKNISGTDYGTADDLFHHNWQELSLQKNIRSLDEARTFLASDEKNKLIWDSLGYSNIMKSNDSEFVKNSFDLSEDGTTFNNPISTFGLVQALSKFDGVVAKSTKNDLKKQKYSYEDYINEYKRTAEQYANEEKKIGTYSNDADIETVKEQYSKYGSVYTKKIDIAGKTYIEAYLSAEAQAEMYNQTEAIKLAKFRASREENNVKSMSTKLVVEEKQKEAARVTVFKDYATKNDKIRKTKKKIEEAKAEEEQKIKNLNEAENAEKREAESVNKKIADKYEAEMRKAGTPLSIEDKAAYLDSLNAKSIAKISEKFSKKKKQVSDRTGTLEARADAATKTDSTSDMFSELEAETKKKQESFLSKAMGLASKAMGLYGKISDFLNGKFDLSSFNFDILSKTGLLNNKFLSKLFNQLGLKEGLFDNLITDLYKTGAAYAKDMLNSAIKLGMSKLMNKSGGAVDDMLLMTVKPLVFSGGDPNYNGTFLRYILLADCPKCLAYLDEYNGITDYTLESPGKEYERGLTAAHNGCHKVSLYVAKKLYAEYRKNNNGTTTSNPDVAEKYAKEVEKLFKETLVYSYNGYTVDTLKEWLNEFSDILKPCMLGTGDILYNGRFKINNGNINILAKIVEVSELSTDNIKDSVSFSATTGMTINGKETGGKFGKNNISNTKKYIDVRNKNIKLIYTYLVNGNDRYSKAEKLTNEALHERLSYPCLSALSKANGNLMNNLLNSDTFGDLSYLMNDVVRASIHKTLILMDSNHLIPYASINSGNTDFTDTSGSIPEFVDYSTSTIYFNNVDGGDGNDSKIQVVSNGKSTKLDKNSFIKIGYKFVGWSTDIDKTSKSDLKYKDSDTITTNTDVRLYAIWEVDPDYANPQPRPEQGETGYDNTVVNNVTEEEIVAKIENILASVVIPDVFKQYNLSFKNFKLVDTYNKSLREVAEETSDKDYKHAMDKIINAYSDINGAYSIKHDTELYTNEYLKFIDIGNENDKLLCYYYSLCYSIVKKWARYMVYSSIESMFGASEIVESYKVDDDYNYILDIYGNKIVENTKIVNTPDQKFAECLSIFKDACDKIREYCLSISKRNEYTVKFDLCGLSDDHIPPFKVNAYSSIEDYEPIEPEAEGFSFKGWSTDPNGNKIINWSTDIIYKNTILFAIWEKANCYIKDFTIRKAKNDSLLEDVVGTIDHENGIIKLYIRDSEVAENKRYYVHLELAKGCTCDIDTKQKLFISETSPTDINVTDEFGNTKYYYIDLNEIAGDYARISYVADNAIVPNPNCTDLKGAPLPLTSLPTAEKTGYTFKGWSLDKKNVVTEDMVVGNVSTVLYAIFEENEYTITYMNSDEEPFDGKHTYPYNTTIKYNEGKPLDIPTKEGYTFYGYYRDKECITDRVNALYKYNYNSDTTLYASWMDDNEYSALYGSTIINNIEVVLSNLIFYTKMIMSNGEHWVINGTGLNVFGVNGSKLRSFTGLIGGKGYIPLGIATIGSEANSTVLVVVRHASKNKVYLYYSPNKGTTWELAMECTRLNLTLSDSTGAETVNYLTFYKTVAYNGHLYSVYDINNVSSIIIDGNENLVLLSAMNSQFDITKGKRILGICATVDEKLYVLFENVGVIMYTNFEPSFDVNDECTLNPNIHGLGVAGWLDNYYNIDAYNIGNPYTAVNSNMNLDDDFDINDKTIIDNIKSYYADEYLYVKTYLKIENDEDPISDLIWIWSFNFANTGIVLSEKSWVVENMDNFRPSTLKDRNVIRLKIKPKYTNYEIPENIDLETVRKVQMTKDNCMDYLGWTRVIYDTEDNVLETIKITEDYLFETDISTGNVREPWFVKYTRSELVTREITTATGEKYIADVYNVPESERSDVFMKYLKYGKI